MSDLVTRLQGALASPEVIAAAAANLARTRSLGLISDWEGAAKETDFARLVAAVQLTFPPGGSIETGVFRGGSAGLLILSSAPEAFHISIDPYGLPGQSYESEDYKQWPTVRATGRRLAELAEGARVTFCPYFMDSQTFVRGNMLRHSGKFNIVHLDGDHSYSAVRAELGYFMRRLAGPTVFILDDHDDHFPGVDQALQEVRHALIPLMHRHYEISGYGEAGFSAWLYPGGLASIRSGARARARQMLEAAGLLPLCRAARSAFHGVADRALSAFCIAIGKRRFTAGYFERRYASIDPWGYQRREYERRKYAQVLEILSPITASDVLELGCAEGVFTEQLAGTCRKIVAVDISGRALDRARARCSGAGNVEFRRLDLFVDPLPGAYDLVICGEILCFAETRDALAHACAKTSAGVRPGGELLLVHLRTRKEHPGGWPARDLRYGADSIHAMFRGSPDWVLVSERREDQYLISLLRKRAPEGPS